MDAQKLIEQERQRQIDVEGWTPAHDDQYTSGELVAAAFCYWDHAIGKAKYRPDGLPQGWPWDISWWKPKDETRDLVRAGALLEAERSRWARMDLPLQFILDKMIDDIATLVEKQ